MLGGAFVGLVQQEDEKGTLSNHFLFIESFPLEYLSPVTIHNYGKNGHMSFSKS